MLSANGIRVTAHGRDLLRDIDITVEPGEVVAVLGPNGAGKSTLLKVLSGDLEPRDGEVVIGETALARLSVQAQAECRAVVQQAPTVAFDFRAMDVIEMGWMADLLPVTFLEQALTSVMTETGTTDLAERIFSTLSGGEQQRVVYTRALLQLWRPGKDSDLNHLPEPRWLLLDEPTANLDVKHAIAMLRSVRHQASMGVGVAVVLHDLSLAARFADRVLLLENGRSAGLGEPKEVMTSDTLSRIYETPVLVEHHSKLDRLVVLS